MKVKLRDYQAVELPTMPCCMKTTGPLPTILYTSVLGCSPVHAENVLVGGDNFVSFSLIPSFSDHRLLETCLTVMKRKTSSLKISP